MRKILTLAASSFIFMAAPAYADENYDNGGWYLRANGGYGTHHDAEFDNSLFNGDVESEGSGTGTLGVGYEFGQGSDFENFRIELDVDSMWSDMGQIGQANNSFLKMRTNTLMANVLYDFENGEVWDGLRLVPYVGVGVGLVQGEVSAQAHDGSINGILQDNPACFGAFNGACSLKDTDTTWGGQLIAGLGVEISENLSWDTHYSYMKAESGGLDFDNCHFNGGVRNPSGTLRANSFSHVCELDDIGAHTLVTGLRYRFGGSPAIVEPPKPVPNFKCWDGAMVFNSSECLPEPVVEPPVKTYTCWDGQTIVTDLSACPPEPVVEVAPSFVCDDGTIVSDQAYCPRPAPVVIEQPVVVQAYNNCGPSNVAIFNVPVSSNPKQMSRLGTMPEFGDSHGLTPTEFYNKLKARYAANATDRAYLNYLFKSMGYSNGFKDANEFMFSEETLPVGTRGLLGLGAAHHYEYSVLPSNDRDRQAFRIQSANGSVVHFMKTCGNYMYACN